MVKNAVAKAWSLPVVSGRRYSDPSNQPASLVAPTITAGSPTSSALPITISGGAGATSWTVQFRVSGGGGYTNEPTGISVGASSFTVDQSLSASTAYDIRIAATDGVTTVYSNVLTMTTSAGGGSGVFFQPDIDAAASVAAMFDDVNTYDGCTVALSTAQTRPGTSKSILIRYPNDEAGVELHVAPFANTTSLFVRHYVYFDSAWSGNWPVAVKTSRFFSTNDFSTGSAEPNASAYISEKLIWQTYAGDPDDLYARGYNNAIFNLDLEGTYGSGVNFANGLPYIRPGYWYKWERWYVMNSATDVSDGVMRVWIDDQLVCDRSNVMYRSTARGCPNGTGWQSMWFGGNYSGATFGHPGINLDRYESGYYLSTTLDR